VSAAVATRGIAPSARPHLFEPDAAGTPSRTLEDAVLAAVESRRLRGTSRCLVCGEDADATGVCRSCGSELS
jgi:hypothetical protein